MSNDKFSLDNKEAMKFTLSDVSEHQLFVPEGIAGQIEKALAPIVNDFYTGDKSIADIAQTIQNNISRYSDVKEPFAPVNLTLNGLSEKSQGRQ